MEYNFQCDIIREKQVQLFESFAKVALRYEVRSSNAEANGGVERHLRAIVCYCSWKPSPATLCMLHTATKGWQPIYCDNRCELTVDKQFGLSR